MAHIGTISISGIIESQFFQNGTAVVEVIRLVTEGIIGFKSKTLYMIEIIHVTFVMSYILFAFHKQMFMEKLL